MGMTIDEIIAKEQEISRIFQTIVDTHITNGGFSLEELYCDDTEMIEEELERCQELADFHNQIVDTMRKYQKIEQILQEQCIIPEGCYPMLKKIKEVVENGNER